MENVTMSIRNGSGMAMNLQSWRGYSAYEIAVQNGFEGTPQQWLESLHGRDGATTSVNGVQQENGNVTLTGADLPVGPADQRKLSEVTLAVDKLSAAVVVTDDGLDLGGRYLDNARFR